MLTYQRLSKEQVAEIYHKHMKLDFPPAELKPLEVLHQLMQQELYQPYGWYDTNGLVAYSFFVKAQKGTILLLDYFAVCAPFRSHGYGGQCLTQMKELWKGKANGILAEVEDPEKSCSAEEAYTRIRRVAFYQRNGLRKTQVYSILFGVPYILHYLPLEQECDDEQLCQELDAVYQTLFPLPVYEANAKIQIIDLDNK